ncbi:hypothetical protein FHX09_005933 [Rhizobium sp. BK538]|nr:GrpB family protein [Rhizobium sp. BK538]MBB4172035.1 hypothetical protein [Rhizobium sp. BK538]
MPTLVELVPYDPYWVRHFSVAEAALKTDLGPNVVAVDHIGSTAIPGMYAKPIIDIDITMSSLSVIPSARAPLVNAGLLEILAPARSGRGTVICDCCRRARSASDFDEDGCGICCGRLESDALLVELDASVRGDERSAGSRLGFQAWEACFATVTVGIRRAVAA